MPAFVVEQPTGTVTDPVWGDVVSVLFIAFGALLLVVTVGALIREGVRWWRETSAEMDRNIAEILNDAELYSAPKPLPLTARACWALDVETPIGNQLLREYVGAFR